MDISSSDQIITLRIRYGIIEFHYSGTISI